MNMTYTWVISNPALGLLGGPIVREYSHLWSAGDTRALINADPGYVFTAEVLASRRIDGPKYRMDTTTALSPGDFLWLDIKDVQGNIREVQVRVELTTLKVNPISPDSSEPIDRDDSLLDALDAYWEHARCA